MQQQLFSGKQCFCVATNMGFYHHRVERDGVRRVELDLHSYCKSVQLDAEYVAWRERRGDQACACHVLEFIAMLDQERPDLCLDQSRAAEQL